MTYTVEHTFVIPAYKNSAYIEDCIISLLNQTVKSKILITTSTLSAFLVGIARKYNIEIFVNDKGDGIANDWNFAYRMCKTKYLTLAHQDDFYEPDYTELCLKEAGKSGNQNSLMVFTGYREYEVDKPRKTSTVLFVKQILLTIFYLKNSISKRFLKRSVLCFGNPISCPSVMFNMENIGPFEFSESYHYVMDWDAWLRLAKMKGQFIFVNRKLMVHRLHDESQTTIQIQNNNRYVEEEKIFQRIWNKPTAKLLMKIYKYSTSSNMKRTV